MLRALLSAKHAFVWILTGLRAADTFDLNKLLASRNIPLRDGGDVTEGRRTVMRVKEDRGGDESDVAKSWRPLKYEAPRLRRMGSLAEITLGSGAGPVDGLNGKMG